MFNCKICTKTFCDIDRVMEHMTNHIREQSETKTYCYTSKNKNNNSDIKKRSSLKDRTNYFESNNSVNNGKLLKCDNGTDKQSDDTDGATSIAETLRINNSVSDVIAGSDAVSIKLEPSDTDSDCLDNNAPVTPHIGSNNKNTGTNVNNETKLCASFTDKNNSITSNTRCNDLYVQNGSMKYKPIRCYSNKSKNTGEQSEMRQSRIIFDGNEEMDATLMVKQEELSCTLTEALNFYSDNDVTGIEVSNKFKCSNNNDRKASVQASFTRSHIKFESDDEIDATVLADIKSEQNYLLYRCDQCDEQFAHKNTLRLHRLKHSGKMPYSCDICGNEFIKNSSLNIHRKKHEKNYSCDNCQKQYTSKTTLREHLLSEAGSKKFLCEICGKKFAMHYQIKRHLVVHTGEKRYSCVECDVSFRNYSSLSYHREIVHTQIQYKCEICNQVYLHRNALFKHNKHCHSNFQGYTCKVCNKVFRLPSSLHRHMGKHNGYALKCSICEKGFTYNYQLVRHKLVHTKEKCFQCDKCEGTFKKKESMTNHIVNRVCEKKRKKKDKKTSRRLKCRRIKRYQCDICNNKFTTKKYLQVHAFKCEKKK